MTLRKPTFLFIGPDKSGSTWLFEILRRHPECWVPPCKDVYFFDRYYDRGMEWYLSFFRDAPADARAVGELSHDYLFSAAAAERIAHDLPGVTLLTCLRDPVERTFSQYLYLVRSGMTRDSFEDALERFPRLVDNSLYHKHLSEYFQRFAREQIRVLFFDDLKRDPEAFAAQVFDALGVSFRDDLPYRERVLSAGRPRSHVLARVAKAGAVLAREAGWATLVGRAKRSALARMLYRPFSDDERPRMRPDTRERLLERMRPDVERLQGLLGVDLSHWLASGREVRA